MKSLLELMVELIGGVVVIFAVGACLGCTAVYRKKYQQMLKEDENEEENAE